MKAYFALAASLGIWVVVTVCPPHAAMFLDWQFALLFIISIVIAPVLAFFLSLPCASVFLGPIYQLRARLNGAPFHVGDRVRILVGPKRDRVVQIYDVWTERSQVRVRLEAQAMRDVSDVFSFTQICRESAPQANSMKPTMSFLGALSILSASITCVSAGELKIDLKLEGKSTAEILLTIEGDIATTKVADETERFNLKNQSWLDPKSGKWTTLAQCKKWAKQSKARSLKSAGAAPENIRPFLLWSLNPTFKIEKVNDTLRLTSGQLDYVTEGKASKAGAEKYFRYAVLNAYKKAMTERKLLPFSELKAITEMNNLGHIPRKISVTMPGIPKAPKYEIEITETKP